MFVFVSSFSDSWVFKSASCEEHHCRSLVTNIAPSFQSLDKRSLQELSHLENTDLSRKCPLESECSWVNLSFQSELQRTPCKHEVRKKGKEPQVSVLLRMEVETWFSWFHWPREWPLFSRIDSLSSTGRSVGRRRKNSAPSLFSLLAFFHSVIE